MPTQSPQPATQSTRESNYSFFSFLQGKPIVVHDSRFDSSLFDGIIQHEEIGNLRREIMESVTQEIAKATDKKDERKVFLLKAYKKAVLDAIGTFEAYQKSESDETKDQFLAALEILKYRNTSTTVKNAIISKTNVLLLVLSLTTMLTCAAFLVGSLFFPPLIAACLPLAYTAAGLLAAAIPAGVIAEGAIIATNQQANLGTKLVSTMKSAAITPLNFFEKIESKFANLKQEKHEVQNNLAIP